MHIVYNTYTVLIHYRSTMTHLGHDFCDRYVRRTIQYYNEITFL